MRGAWWLRIATTAPCLILCSTSATALTSCRFLLACLTVQELHVWWGNRGTLPALWTANGKFTLNAYQESFPQPTRTVTGTTVDYVQTFTHSSFRSVTNIPDREIMNRECGGPSLGEGACQRQECSPILLDTAKL